MNKERYGKVTGGWSIIQEGGIEPTNEEWEALAEHYTELKEEGEIMPAIDIDLDVEGASHTAILFQKPRGMSWDEAMPALKEEIFDELRGRGVNPELPNRSFLSIKLPCGNEANYKAFDDIPKVDTPCPCGNSNHWFVQYREK